MKLLCWLRMHAKLKRRQVGDAIAGYYWAMYCPRCSKILGYRDVRM